MTSQTNPSDDSGPMTWSQCVWYGLGSIGLGILVIVLLTWIESRPQGGRVHWLIALLYNIGGKWVAAGIFFAVGLLFFVAALVKFQKKDE